MGNILVMTTKILHQLSRATTTDITVKIVVTTAIVLATTVVEDITITIVVAVAVIVGPTIKSGAGWKILLPQDMNMIILQTNTMNTIILLVIVEFPRSVCFGGNFEARHKFPLNSPICLNHRVMNISNSSISNSV